MRKMQRVIIAIAAVLMLFAVGIQTVKALSAKNCSVFASQIAADLPSPNLTPKPNSLSIALSPQHIEVVIGQKVNFTAIVTGGKAPYTCHWYSQYDYLGNPLAEIATSANFTFTPSLVGIYHIRFSIEDSLGESSGQLLTPIGVKVIERQTSSPSFAIIPSVLPIPTNTPSPTLTLSPQVSIPEFPTWAVPLTAITGAILAITLRKSQKVVRAKSPIIS
jgi:hypothetical protein